MIMRHFILVVVALCLLDANAFPRNENPRVDAAVTEAQDIENLLGSSIRQAFGNGLVFGSEDVTVLGARGMSRTSLALRVDRILVDGPRQKIDVRVKCTNGGCLPFYVLIGPKSIPDSLKHRVVEVRPTYSGKAITAENSFRTKASVVKAGSPLLLVVTTPQMRVSIPTVSLETRRSGEALRVRAVGTNRIYSGILTQPNVTSSAGASVWSD
ncbi:MAG TPA: hypothetical protein VD837_13645 [Terriglobales bacterium]|nr:hypothetical protein [Terriglobales bacterium]